MVENIIDKIPKGDYKKPRGRITITTKVIDTYTHKEYNYKDVNKRS